VSVPAGAGHRPALARLLAPASVAVVGASEGLGGFTGSCVHNLLRYGFTGRIHPVNPRRAEVLGLTCHPSLAEVPGPVDSAVLLVGADRVLPVLEDCVAAGIDNVIVAASGFGEGGAGPAGLARRRALDAFLDRHRITLLGPSTTGVVNLFDRYVPRAATNMIGPDGVVPGPVAVVSQSGASSNIVFNRAQDHGLAVGLAVATGLQATLTTWDVVEHLATDDRVRVLALIVEELGPAAVWRPRVQAAAAAGQQVVLCRVGTSDRGAAAAASHTGAVAGHWRSQRAALLDAGVLVVDDLDQLWEVAALCAAWGPASAPARLGVVALSGGEGALISDQATAAGIAMPDPSDAFVGLVGKHLTLTRGANPFDPSGEILGKPDLLVPMLEQFFDDPAFDRVLLAWHVLDQNVLPAQQEALDDLFARYRHRLVVTAWPLSTLDGWHRLAGPGAPPLLPGSHRAVAALARWSGSAPIMAVAPAVTAPVTLPARLGTGYHEVRELLAGLGVPFGPARRAEGEDAAAAAAAAIGPPVVLKSDVDSITHKSAAGLVELGLVADDQVRAAWRRLHAATGSATVIVEAQLTGELQVFLGARRDLDAGPVLVFGSGGSAVEYLDDIGMVPAGADPRRAIAASRVGRFLADHTPAVTDALADMLAALGGVVTDPRIAAVEVNPVMVDLRRGTALAVDARIELSSD
jgi:acetate---CoA ligase (ADP-forming)